ncbi:MFS transporter [Paracoccus cavernae]|uniref:MFS transporter n=1 Tax=Paracoccus cavernae TaxID=1571207 RepID=UPI0035F36233
MASNRWLVLAIVSSALLLIVIDMTVLYTALPRLTHDLRANASEKLWILNAYPLVVAGLLPGLGTLGDRFGHRRMFLGGLAVFGAASLIAAFAPVPAVLIAGRVLLAVGAAAMMPATLSLIRLTFEDENERAFAIGIWAAVASGGAAFGPVLGGILLEHFWWGSVFLINVPIVALAFVAALAFIPARPGNAQAHWDALSSLQIMVALIGLAYAVKEMAKREPLWWAVAVAAALGLLALVLFIRRQRRLPHPLIDLRLFGNAQFSAGVIAALCASMVMVGVELALTQRLQLVQGKSPLEAALFILPIPIGAFVAGPVTGLLLPRLGPRAALLAGLGLCLTGVLAMMPLRDAATVWQMLPLGLLGLGIGAAMTAASSTIMLSAPSERAGMAAAVEEVSYELGGALGIAILGTVMSLGYRWSMPVQAELGAAASDGTIYDSLDEALLVAETLPAETSASLITTARAAFEQAFLSVGFAAALILGLTCLLIFRRGRSAA